MEDERSDVIDHDEDVALVTIDEGTIDGEKSKADGKHLLL